MKISNMMITSAIAALIVTGVSISAYNASDKHNEHNTHQDLILLMEQVPMDIDQALTIALTETPGEVINAELERDDEETIWEIDVLGLDQTIYRFEIATKDGRIVAKEIASTHSL